MQAAKNHFRIAIVLATILLVFMVTISFVSSGVIGGADTYMHHLIARWSFVHPHLFLDHWGKPVFTILSSPFAQFGLMGSVVFNVLLTVLSGLISYKLATNLKINNPWLAVLFVVFVPVFFLVGFSSLTETLFATFLITAIYFFNNEKYVWSIILVSFIPFIRTEGVIFFPLFLIALMFLKKHKSIAYLGTGFLFFTLIGAWYFKDLWWVINNVPYGVSSSLYGSGMLSHFIVKSPMLFGWPILILFGLGSVLMIKNWSVRISNKPSVIYFLLLSVSVGYFLAHSVVWALGMGSSAGLTRVMAGIAPVVGMVALIGFDLTVGKLKPTQFTQVILPVLVGLVIVIEGVTKHSLPIDKDREMVVVEAVSKYINQEGLKNDFIVYWNPMVAYELGLDHFETKYSTNAISNTDVETNLEAGSIIIWDAHFSPSEGGISKSIFESNPDFLKLKTFHPESPFTVSTGEPYEVHIFQKQGN